MGLFPVGTGNMFFDAGGVFQTGRPEIIFRFPENQFPLRLSARYEKNRLFWPVFSWVLMLLGASATQGSLRGYAPSFIEY